MMDEENRQATLEAMALDNPRVRKRLGGRIRKRRTELGMSQVALADLMGVQRASMSQYESGAAGLDAADLPRLGKALQVTPNYLFGIDTDVAEPDITTMGEAILVRYFRVMSEEAQAQALRVLETLCVYDSEVRGVPVPKMHIVYREVE